MSTDSTKEKIIAFLRGIVIVGYLIYAPYYLYWRLGTFNPDAMVFSWIIWGAEVFGYVTALLHVFMVNRLTSPTASSPPAGYSVDVFITAYNESASLLTHTLRAAVQMDYPHKTWLLDDGNNPEMKTLAKHLGCRYLTRQSNTDAKAGNLNNALGNSTADFIAVFDADHVPRKDFLTRTLGFFRDEKIAFVQTPQDFYNLDSYQHRRHKRLSYIWTEQSLFFRIIQRGKDRWNAAFFCGSCAVMRTSVLKKIGGFATGTVTEDLHTSIRIHKHGYKSVYINESLAYGLAPDSAKSFLSQRLRWGQGAIQVWRKEGILFSRGLTFAQRLNYLASVLTYFDGWTKAIFYVAPIVVLTTGVMPIHVLGTEFLVHFVPFYLLCFWAYEEAGRGYGRTLLTEQYNMARFAVFLRASLSGFRSRLHFAVTPKQAESDAATERSNILPQIIILAASIAAIVIGILLWASTQHLTSVALVANIIWAGINLGLAGAVVRFTTRKKHRRHDYRFPIPLPIQIRTGDGQFVALAEDLSLAGCKVVSESVLKGDVEPIEGRLYLPTGELFFNGILQRHFQEADTISKGATAYPDRPSRKKLEYGLIFNFESKIHAAQLEKFLYGSDLQWQILDLHEDITTPVAWLIDLITGVYPAKRLANLSPKEWLPVIYNDIGSVSGQKHLAAISRTDWERLPARLLMFEPVPAHSRLELSVFGQEGSSRLTGQVVEIYQLHTPTAEPVYIAHIALSPGAAQYTQKRISFLRTATTSVLLLFAVLAFLAFTIFPTVSWGRDWLGLAGAEIGEDHAAYAYLGTVVPFSGENRLGKGWVQRYWLDWLEYRYEANNDIIRAEAPGVSAAVGYQDTYGKWQWGAYTGPAYRDTRLSPDKPDARVRGGQTGVLVLGEAERLLANNWRFSGIVSFVFDPDSYWSRVRLMRKNKPDNRWQGIEIILQGDPDYDAGKFGVVFDALQTGKDLGLTFKVGLNKTQGLNPGLYAGVELVRLFH